MKVIITGSRTINQIAVVLEAIAESGFNITEVVSGCAYGVDKLGESFALSNEIPIAYFPAEWGKYSNSAGPIRNRQMAKYADALIAVWDGNSKGTRNMINEAKKANLKIFVHDLTSDESRVK